MQNSYAVYNFYPLDTFTFIRYLGTLKKKKKKKKKLEFDFQPYIFQQTFKIFFGCGGILAAFFFFC